MIAHRLAVALLLCGAAIPSIATPPQAAPAGARYGLIGKMIAQPGKRDALAAVLAQGIAAMPGCISYVVARDPADPDALWTTEVWVSKAAHDASLKLPAVKQAIAIGHPLIAAMGDYHETVPIVGTGIVAGGR